MTIRTDHKWKNFLYGHELPKKARKDFDWMTEEEFETADFICYRGTLYALSEFEHIEYPEREGLRGWDGKHCDTFFSATLIKISHNGEQYKVGYCYA